MKDALRKLLIIGCALYLSGAHWVALQTTAWTGMLVSRSIGSSLLKAVQSTFDGQHPCRACKVIAKARQTEERSQQEFELLKKSEELKYLEVRPLAAGSPVPMLEPVWWPLFVNCFGRGSDAPPTPPPLS